MILNKDVNILIVEDEIISTEYLKNILYSLEFENIFTAENFEEALEEIKKQEIDLIFMDINIRGSIDGINCAKILNKHYFLPIIFTTAYCDKETMIEAVNTNCFGYIVKPFSVNEVQSALLLTLSKIKELKSSIKKETNNLEQSVVSLGFGQKFDFENKTFYINNIAVNLTKNESNLLYAFCKNINQNFSYETMKEEVWANKDISDSTIRDTVSRLKRKVPNLNIENIVNVGYILKKNN